jgi:uncharacterized membrane protein (UPF0127 family)
MFRGGLGEGEALLIQPCSSVHMFFMRFPLDVAFIDKQGAVVKIAAGLKPWRVAMGGKGAWCALELPSGAAAGAVNVGDTLTWD